MTRLPKAVPVSVTRLFMSMSVSMICQSLALFGDEAYLSKTVPVAVTCLRKAVPVVVSGLFKTMLVALYPASPRL